MMTKAEKNAFAQKAWRNGMTSAQLKAFFDEHGNRCGICQRTADEVNLVVDHDHDCCPGQAPAIPWKDRQKRLCGECARGLLCVTCNTGLGNFKDKEYLLHAAMAYLNREGG